MTEPDNSAVPAPFDSLPEEGDAADEASPETRARFSFPLGRLGLIALFVVFAGIGQGVAVTLFFGDDKTDLSDQVEKEVSEALREAGALEDRAARDAALDHVPVPISVPSHPPAPKESPVVVQLPPEKESAGEMDELRIARDRFKNGDVEGARRIAGAWLLRMDGMAPEDAAREPEAYAVLADVLRRDLERTSDERSPR